MKKYLLLLVLSLLFVVPIGANAATKNMRIDFDSHDKFNYFYEQKNNTPFYQFLVGQGSELKNTLSAYSYNNPNSNKFTLRIYYRSELNIDSVNLSIPDDAYYFIITDCGGTNDILRLDFDGKNANITDFDNGNNIQYTLFNNNAYSKIYYFDQNADYLGYNDLTTNNFISLLKYNDVYDLSKTKNSDFTYFISKFYYFSNDFIIYVNDFNVIVSELYIDNKIYLIDDNSNYSSFLSFFRNLFTSSENYNVVNTNLEYFKTSKVYSPNIKPLSLCRMINFYSKGISVPSNFVSVEVSDLFGTYLVPKVTNTNVNSNIYISSTGFPKIRIAYWSLVDGVVTYIGNDKRTEEEIIRSNFVGNLNYMPKIENNDLLFYNYLYHFSYQYAASENNSPLKYTYTLYYNPDVFDVVYYSTDTGVVFNYPGTDLEITLSPDTIAGNNYSGATSENIFATDYGNGSLGDYFDWLDSISANPDGSISFAGILTKIIDFVKSFGLIISSIFSMVTLVFSSLPEEVQIILLFGMFTGFILIIYKLIRG